ncbi:DUF3331 domain-containing protein [Paraburkholderia graminis]|uniref:DUF3331 domain-containing protein n=1 Tax=Paraburkholderia graminis TaxID=60548 RepID=UPI00286B4903|nr:DUF3331 domain-containing protein [Paraburkholderia graminis]
MRCGRRILLDRVSATKPSQVIRSLYGATPTGYRDVACEDRAPALDRYTVANHARVEVLERLTERTVLINWSDATRCRYVDQVWILCKARKLGRCALTGRSIRRGDAVYKPRRRSVPQLNTEAMIWATAIPD